ncbi:MAG: hypothetical protein Q7S61_05380 [bacterium]|nr:hypothetical protein [bacterium]
MITTVLKFIKTREFLLLILIFIIGLWLRTFKLWDNFIFGYDQARDAQRIFDIIHKGDIKLVGPETDIPGVFHGVLYYYILAPVYFLAKMDPNPVLFFLSLVNMSGIFIIYWFSLILFNKKTIALLSSLLWAISYEQASYSKFLSNPSLMPIFVLLFFFGLAVFLLRKKTWGLYVSMLFLGASFHANFFLLYLVLLLPVFLTYFEIELSLKEKTITLLFFALPFIPHSLAEIRWNFNQTRSFLLFLSRDTNTADIMERLGSLLQKISLHLYYSFFSFNNFIAFLFLVVGVFIIYKESRSKKSSTFLLFWILSIVPLFAFKSGVHNTYWITALIHGGTTLLFAYIAGSLLYIKKTLPIGVLLIVIFILSNLNLYKKDNFNNTSLFALQNMTYAQEKKLMDYTYKNANGNKFSICAVTNPLFVNTLWSYLYTAYGQKQYGYLPYWSGQKQYLNSNLLPYDEQHVPLRYLIIEPLGAIPPISKEITVYTEDKVSTFIEEKKFGDLLVQKRILKKPESLFTDTQGLNRQQLKSFEEILGRDYRYTCFNSY